MQDGKFHPHTEYKGVRKSRDQQKKTQGVKIVRKERIIDVFDPTGGEGFPDIETELTDIFDEVADVDTGEIDFKKLEESAEDNIRTILKREKVLKKGDQLQLTFVDAREETGRKEFERTGRSGDSGFYQYDYRIIRDGMPQPLSGTAFGSISHGDVLDMELEFYDTSKMVAVERKARDHSTEPKRLKKLRIELLNNTPTIHDSKEELAKKRIRINEIALEMAEISGL